jgi:hypothetical protein
MANLARMQGSRSFSLAQSASLAEEETEITFPFALIAIVHLDANVAL